jgi:hypothetical protein
VTCFVLADEDQPLVEIDLSQDGMRVRASAGAHRLFAAAVA